MFPPSDCFRIRVNLLFRYGMCCFWDFLPSFELDFFRELPDGAVSLLMTSPKASNDLLIAAPSFISIIFQIGTNMNARSSRSHTIFRIIIESHLTEAAAAEEASKIAMFDEGEKDKGGGGGGGFKSVTGKSKDTLKNSVHVGFFLSLISFSTHTLYRIYLNSII